jgi:hypothetical protein
MGERSGLPSPAEPAFAVQRDCRIVTGCDPQTQAGSATFARPPDHSVHESAADTMPTRFRGNEHRDEHGSGIVRLVRVAVKPRCHPDPLPVSLGHEIHAVGSCGPALCSLAPDMFRELLLPCQRRAKRHGHICEGTQPKCSQLQSLICANPPNLYGHLGAASSVTKSSRPSLATMTSTFEMEEVCQPAAPPMRAASS